jgi:hypothetical protein
MEDSNAVNVPANRSVVPIQCSELHWRQIVVLRAVLVQLRQAALRQSCGFRGNDDRETAGGAAAIPECAGSG